MTEEPSDRGLIGLTAAKQGIGEYEIFRKVFKHLPETQLEKKFGEYLKSGKLPLWVRHYCRGHISSEETL